MTNPSTGAVCAPWNRSNRREINHEKGEQRIDNQEPQEVIPPRSLVCTRLSIDVLRQYAQSA